MKRTPATLLPVCVLAALVATILAGPATAKTHSPTPCWKTLINDWYDGRIDGTYAIPCYHEAINHLPSDVQAYSSAADDIRRALQERISGKKSSGKGSGATGATGPAGAAGGEGSGGSASGGRKAGGGPLGDAINAGSPSHADSVPIPLLVLAGIAGLLLLAGSTGFVVRRLQARRVPIRQGPSGPPQ